MGGGDGGIVSRPSLGRLEGQGMAALIFRFSARAQPQLKPLQRRAVTTDAELLAPRGSGYGSLWGTDTHVPYAPVPMLRTQQQLL